MPLKEYIDLFHEILHEDPNSRHTEVYRIVEDIHYKRYGYHKCNTYEVFKSMKWRHLKERRAARLSRR